MNKRPEGKAPVRINIVIDGVAGDYDCYPSTVEPKTAQEEPSIDPRLDWTGTPDLSGAYLEVVPCSQQGHSGPRVLVNIDGYSSAYQTAPQLYAAALAFVRAGMALDGYMEEITLIEVARMEDHSYLNGAAHNLKALISKGGQA